MIVRRLENGGLRLITQIDHAKLSGLFASHWGNALFTVPRRLESVVRGTVFHDIGWLRYEALPRYDASRNWSPTFFEVPSDAEQLDAFQWGIDWLTAIDAYAGLLISRHRTGLWRDRYSALAHPRMSGGRKLSESIEHFVSRNEAEQERALKSFDAAAFGIDFRLLQVWDLLSLYLCTADPREEHIEPVPTTYSATNGEGVRIDLRPLGPNRVSIDPYPFDCRPLKVSVVCRELSGPSYPDEAAFRLAFWAAEPRALDFEFT